MEAVHDTTPLSRFIVLTIFTIRLRRPPSALFHLLQPITQSFLPLLQQLHELQLVSPLPLLLVLHVSISSSSFPTFASTSYCTPHLTIQITSWRRTVQGILPSSNPCYILPSPVVLLPYRLCCTLPRTPLISPLCQKCQLQAGIKPTALYQH